MSAIVSYRANMGHHVYALVCHVHQWAGSPREDRVTAELGTPCPQCAAEWEMNAGRARYAALPRALVTITNTKETA